MQESMCPAEVPGTSWGCGDWPHRLLLPADAVKEHRKILIRPRRKSREEEAC